VSRTQATSPLSIVHPRRRLELDGIERMADEIAGCSATRLHRAGRCRCAWTRMPNQPSNDGRRIVNPTPIADTNRLRSADRDA